MQRIVGSVSRWAKKQAKVMGGIGAGAVVGLAGVAVVSASIPDASGVIHGCYRTNNGTLRIIDSASQTCAGNEAALTWNQTGPQGPAGATGPQGPAGPQGPQGPAGSGGVLIPNLVGADLRGAVMVGWDLSGKDFTNANLGSSRLGGSNLTGAIFTGASFLGATFTGVNLSGGSLSGATFGGNTFDDGNFTGANLTNAKFVCNGSTPIVCSSNGSNGGNFTGANLTGVTVKAALFFSNFSGANFTNAQFVADAVASGEQQTRNINFSGANFTGVTFTAAAGRSFGFHFDDFTGVNLAGTNIASVATSWESTICPDGTNSNANGNTCIGHLTP